MGMEVPGRLPIIQKPAEYCTMPKLNDADRIALHELCGRFAITLDAGIADGVAALFTEDGAYYSVRHAVGRANILALFEVLIADRANPNKNIRNALHISGTPVVDGCSETGEATGINPFLMLGTNRNAPPVPAGTPFKLRLSFDEGQPTPLVAGWYQDSFRKVEGQWYFVTRRALSEIPIGFRFSGRAD
jgi:hypothetical protein